MAECARLASTFHVPLSKSNVWELILSTDTFAGELEFYAEAVIDFARRREQGSDHLREAAAVLAGDDCEITLRRKLHSNVTHWRGVA